MRVENDRLTDRAPSETLIELCDAINRGDKRDAFDMLYRYANDEEHREIIDRARY